MVLQLFCSAIAALITAILSVFPVISLPTTQINNAVDWFVSSVNTLGFFLPLDTVSLILLGTLAVYAAKFAISVINWTIKKIPTIS